MLAQSIKGLVVIMTFFLVSVASASSEAASTYNFTDQWTAWLCLLIFLLAFLLVFGEERLTLKKSKPMIVASGLIWILVAITYNNSGDIHSAEVIFRQSLEFYVEIFLFLLVSTTYVNAMSERGVFVNIRQSVMSRGTSLRVVFWVTGGLTFIFSAFLANFAVALVLATVILVLAKDDRKFIVCSCISLVVAANAGGSFSPFGDVTTLMVWQKDAVELWEFPKLFLPSFTNWFVPALILSFGFKSVSTQHQGEDVQMSKGAWIVSALFLVTLFMAIIFKQVFHLPAMIGMMTGLGFLKFYGFYLKRKGVTHLSSQTAPGEEVKFDIFRSLERSEWDTLMFLYGVMISISGLAALGYLELLSHATYASYSTTTANIILGVLSAFVDNAAVMYSVILMHPDMNTWQWLLITLTTGVGGSLLATGSAAGIVVMGISENKYTFWTHLKWSWAILLGYFASVGMHILVN